MPETYEFYALLNEEDELPMRQWLAAGRARLLRGCRSAFPPEEVEWSSLEQTGRDEILAIWYEDVYSWAELVSDFSRDESGFESWYLPVLVHMKYFVYLPEFFLNV